MAMKVGEALGEERPLERPDSDDADNLTASLRGKDSTDRLVLTNSSTNKKVPLWRLVLLSAAAGAVDLGYAVEAAYAVPLMLASGLSLTLSTVVLTISPVFGIFFQGFLGSASDQCTCSWGKRRPFIVLFSITACLGFAGAPYCFYFDNLNIHILVIIGIVTCVFLLDFSIGALQLPARAYLLDVVPLEQTQTGNFIISITVGINAALGYGIGVINWSSIAGESVSVIHQARIIFGVTAGLIFIQMLCTIISVKEKKPNLPNVYVKGNNDKRHTERSNSPASLQIQGDKMNTLETIPLISYQQTPHSSCFDVFCCCRVVIESMMEIVQFIYYMSWNMWLTCFVVVLGLAGDRAFCYSYTTFVGIAVYKGDPHSSEESNSYQLYTQGVRMGSLGLAIATVCCSIVSFGLDFVTRWIRLKTVLLFVLAAFACSLCLLMYVRELYQVYILTAFYGPYFGIILAFPFTLIPIYENTNLMFRKEWAGRSKSVEGKAVAVINMAIFLGQIIAVSVIGPVVDAVGDVNYFMMIPLIFITLSFFIALPIQTPVLDK